MVDFIIKKSLVNFTPVANFTDNFKANFTEDFIAVLHVRSKAAENRGKNRLSKSMSIRFMC